MHRSPILVPGSTDGMEFECIFSCPSASILENGCIIVEVFGISETNEKSPHHLSGLSDASRDVRIGSSLIELNPLWLGFPVIDGWYHISPRPRDISAGQIHVLVQPSQFPLVTPHPLTPSKISSSSPSLDLSIRRSDPISLSAFAPSKNDEFSWSFSEIQDDMAELDRIQQMLLRRLNGEFSESLEPVVRFSSDLHPVSSLPSSVDVHRSSWKPYVLRLFFFNLYVAIIFFLCQRCLSRPAHFFFLFSFYCSLVASSSHGFLHFFGGGGMRDVLFPDS